MIALVGNDAGWTQIEREQAPMFGSSVACKLAVSIPYVVYLLIYFFFLLFIYSQFYPTLPESVALCLLTTVPVEL